MGMCGDIGRAGKLERGVTPLPWGKGRVRRPKQSSKDTTWRARRVAAFLHHKMARRKEQWGGFRTKADTLPSGLTPPRRLAHDHPRTARDRRFEWDMSRPHDLPAGKFLPHLHTETQASSGPSTRWGFDARIRPAPLPIGRLPGGTRRMT